MVHTPYIDCMHIVQEINANEDSYMIVLLVI